MEVVVLTFFMILVTAFFIATFLMVMNLKKWMTKRDEYYEEKHQYYDAKIKYNDEAFSILKEVKKVINNLNLQYGNRNEPLD